MAAEEPYIKKDKMTIKISKRNYAMLNKVETNQTPQKKGGNTV